MSINSFYNFIGFLKVHPEKLEAFHDLDFESIEKWFIAFASSYGFSITENDLIIIEQKWVKGNSVWRQKGQERRVDRKAWGDRDWIRIFVLKKLFDEN
jgi:hypothetical protein